MDRPGVGPWSAAAIAVGMLAATALAEGPVAPPAPVLATAETRYALMLEEAALRSSTSLTEEARSTAEPGTVLSWLGETTDNFGRTWQILGGQDAWQLRETWYVAPFEPEQIPSGEPSAWITGFREPPEEPGEEAESSMSITSDWWTRTVTVGAGHPYRAGDLVAVPGVTLPTEDVQELLGLIDSEALGPWPERPAWGQLHVPAALPLVFVYGPDGWAPREPPRFVAPGPDLLGNPRLRQRPNAPVEAAGRPAECWTLVGALDPAGAVVGRLEVAAEEPASVEPRELPAIPGARFFGYRDLAERILPTAPRATARPVLAVPSEPAGGVRLADESRRQAVFLEQRLPVELVRWLRGRTLMLRVEARQIPGSEGTGTAGVELIAGETRETMSRSVGERRAELTLEVVVPDDAEEIIVRLMPQDRSIAVQELGSVIFDGASLLPAEWRPTPAPLMLRRVRLAHYQPARRYTQARVAVSEGPPERLTEVWTALAGGEWSEPERRTILEGRLEPGMSRAAAELAWGAPIAREETGAVTRWDWPDRSATFTREGELIAWTSRRGRGEARPARCLGGLFEAGGAPAPAPTGER